MKRQIPWLRVFVEGVVIVGSILLAFGLQAWWEGRQDSQLEDRYLERLATDLESDTAEIRTVVARTDQRLSSFGCSPTPSTTPASLVTIQQTLFAPLSKSLGGASPPSRHTPTTSS